ncbi:MULTISPECIES: type IV pilus modification PilV family protein [Paenibacillus]|uniref:type IV pilus modification PilV family protein n=1 Tax=Paenibacillus TaxID=44249 RepID=UPI0022B8909A|nr:prepilin-type N-terminal cleavage/methylation domain-containing protein [Paenibacillus caseinilyticus]MCZ8519768.1 prepilin-type N-terminal cleavage/methylation domain-containing protein [Paenibacillus caseinilyticus]
MSNHSKSREEGFTLIEVLAATVILAIAGLTMTAFFINAMTYNKANQNKTVMVNLARNALFYMEKQGFEQMKNMFDQEGAEINIANSSCNRGAGANGIVDCTKSGELQTLLKTKVGAWDILRPRINNVDYSVTVTRVAYQANGVMDVKGKYEDIFKNNPKIAEYLLPVTVSVKVHSDGTESNATLSKRESVMVEGYIANEYIR